MTATDRIIERVEDWKAFLKKCSPSQIVVLTDDHTAQHCLPHFEDHFSIGEEYHHLSVDPGEDSKSLETVEAIYATLMELEVDRNALLINIGGGVITDLGGYVGATYKRGMSVVNVPTTHLGMVDASLGGKNGVNFEGVKNQIGTFHPAEAIVLDPAFLDTLGENELLSGWIETVKHAVIADASLWKDLKQKPGIRLAKDLSIIRRSAAIKSRIAAEDTSDQGIRQALNFGHTIGHAIEAMGKLLHGEAVAIGMIAELYLSEKLAKLNPQTSSEIIAYILQLGMPIRDWSFDADDLLERMRHDKKNTSGELRFALISHLGRAEVGIGTSPDLVKESLDFAQRQLST